MHDVPQPSRWRVKMHRDFPQIDFQNALWVNWQQWIALRTNNVRAKKVLLILNCFHLITAHCTDTHSYTFIFYYWTHRERAACERACDENMQSSCIRAWKHNEKYGVVYISNEMSRICITLIWCQVSANIKYNRTGGKYIQTHTHSNKHKHNWLHRT